MESKFQFQRNEPLYRQIVADLENKIFSGKLPPGTKIPNSTRLADYFGVTVNTVQHGLDILHTRGLVERMRRKGTFVSNKVRSGTIGVVFGVNILSAHQYRFYQFLLNRLILKAKANNWDIRSYFPPDVNYLRKTLSEIERDSADGRLRALIALVPCDQLEQWLEKECDLPWCILPSESVDYRYFCRLGISHLIGLGHRNISYIPPNPIGTCSKEHLQGIREAFDAVSLPLPENIISSHGYTDRRGYVYASKYLLPLPRDSRPSALLVGDDNFCRGIIYALLNAGWRIPEDISIISHANKGIDIFFPKNITRLEIDPDDFADYLFFSIMAKIGNSQPLPQKPILPVLVSGETCAKFTNSDYV